MTSRTDPAMETPHFEVERLRDDQVVERKDLSFEIDLTPEEAEVPADEPQDVPQEKAAVQGIAPTSPAPEPTQAEPREKKKPENRQQRKRKPNSRCKFKLPTTIVPPPMQIFAA